VPLKVICPTVMAVSTDTVPERLLNVAASPAAFGMPFGVQLRPFDQKLLAEPFQVYDCWARAGGAASTRAATTDDNNRARMRGHRGRREKARVTRPMDVR
jgi:hypothetical protein